MKVIKAGEGISSGVPDAQELEMINTYSRSKLAAEDVYTFSLVLCDNDIDRDFERFEERTLQALAELFVGKTGISDHEWKSGNQVARIYRCEYQTQQGRKTADGRDYACVKAWAYILRNEENAVLIADIDGGIKREVSVGCAVSKATCSVCGADYCTCGHRKGESYNGDVCVVVLDEPTDAYELSFVAVPPQRGAGVTKAAGATLYKSDSEQAPPTGEDPDNNERAKQLALAKALVDLMDKITKI